MCNCINITEDDMRENHPDWNARLDWIILWNKDGKSSHKRMRVAMVKATLSKRTKPPLIVSTYCPFCGEKYPEEKVG